MELQALVNWQRKLIYYPGNPSYISYSRFKRQETWLNSGSYKLQGWCYENMHLANDDIVLYFGGNAEDVAHSLDFLSQLPCSKIYTFNYRGYGLSEGKPSQIALYDDALSIYQFLTSEVSHPPKNIHIIGRSLGSAVATYLSSHKRVASVTLLTPIKSIEAIAKLLFPYLPISLVLADKYRIIELANTTSSPMQMIIAGRDEIVPNDHSLALYEAWGGRKHCVTIDQADHNNITAFDHCLNAMCGFLRGFHPSP